MPKTLPTHLYEKDGVPTRPDGPEGCLHCPLPQSHAVHDLPAVSVEAAAEEARRMGEVDRG